MSDKTEKQKSKWRDYIREYSKRPGMREKASQRFKRWATNNKEKVRKNIRWSNKKRNDFWNGLIAQHGKNHCSKCGYSKCISAIDFHHINPKEKEFNVSQLKHKGTTETNISIFIAELNKCIALCANFHREIHVMEYN